MNGSYGSRHDQKQPEPLISFIIPVFNVEGYLADCVDSITRQDFKNIEIIAVDGASEDTSGEILDDMGKKEPRLTVVHMTENGPGRARNEGVERATGEYIWFVDGDDIVSPGCLALITKHIEATRPDVLFVDYEAFYPDGKSQPGHGHKLLGRETPELFTLAEQPWVIELSMTSWNKVIRRKFFTSASAAFPLDWPHEDVPVSCLLLMESEKLSALNQVCYRYRKDRAGSAMTTGSEEQKHFNIFNSYQAVLDDVGKRASNGDQAVTEKIQRAFFDRAIRHYTAILEAKGLIAGHDRREFFEKMHRDYIRYIPSGYQRPSGFLGIKFRLIERNAYRAYSILEPVNRFRVILSHGVRVARRRLTQYR